MCRRHRCRNRLRANLVDRRASRTPVRHRRLRKAGNRSRQAFRRGRPRIRAACLPGLPNLVSRYRIRRVRLEYFQREPPGEQACRRECRAVRRKGRACRGTNRSMGRWAPAYRAHPPESPAARPKVRVGRQGIRVFRLTDWAYRPRGRACRQRDRACHLMARKVRKVRKAQRVRKAQKVQKVQMVQMVRTSQRGVGYLMAGERAVLWERKPTAAPPAGVPRRGRPAATPFAGCHRCCRSLSTRVADYSCYSRTR